MLSGFSGGLVAHDCIKIIAIRNKKEFLLKEIFNGKNFIKNSLNQINHDEILFAFVPRRHLAKSYRFKENCLESSSYAWVGFFLYQKINIDSELIILDQMVLIYM